MLKLIPAFILSVCFFGNAFAESKSNHKDCPKNLDVITTLREEMIDDTVYLKHIHSAAVMRFCDFRDKYMSEMDTTNAIEKLLLKKAVPHTYCYYEYGPDAVNHHVEQLNAFKLGSMIAITQMLNQFATSDVMDKESFCANALKIVEKENYKYKP